VNGKLQERLEGRKKRVLNTKYNRLESMPMQETLVFPLQHIGDKINGFKGQLKNVKVTQE
jgi:hexosaminidase